MRRLFSCMPVKLRHGLALSLGMLAGASGAALAGSADLDPSFAQSGRSLIPVSSSGGQAYASALQPDGKLILGGWAGEVPYAGAQVNRQFAMFRQFANGNYDPSFGPSGNGITIRDFFGGNDSIVDMAYTAQGIYVVGHAYNYTSPYQILARYTHAGVLDTSFGVNGYVEMLLGANDSINAIAIQSDGKIVIGGSVQDVNGYHDFYVARHNIDGTLDSTFGTNGSVRFSATNNYETVHDIVIQRNGRIVFVGDMLYNGLNVAYVNGLMPSGQRDFSFGNNGITLVSRGSTEVYGRRLSLTGDDQVLVGSLGMQLPGFISGTYVSRLTSNGVLDTSFRNGGAFDTFNLQGSRTLGAIEATPDGAVLIAGGIPASGGSGASVSYVARYNSDGGLDTGFNGTGYKWGDIYANSPYGASAEFITMMADGRFYVGGHSGDQYIAPSYFYLLRYQGYPLILRPTDIYFSAQNFVLCSALITSPVQYVAGLGGRNVMVPITVSGGMYSINNGPATSATGMVRNGDAIRVMQTSSASPYTTTQATLSIGGMAPANNRNNVYGDRMTTVFSAFTGNCSTSGQGY